MALRLWAVRRAQAPCRPTMIRELGGCGVVAYCPGTPGKGLDLGKTGALTVLVYAVLQECEPPFPIINTGVKRDGQSQTLCST